MAAKLKASTIQPIKIYYTRIPACKDRVASTLAVFHEDMNKDDNNELSTNGKLHTDSNTATIITDALGSTRINTIIEMPRKPERKKNHQ